MMLKSCSYPPTFAVGLPEAEAKLVEVGDTLKGESLLSTSLMRLRTPAATDLASQFRGSMEGSQREIMINGSDDGMHSMRGHHSKANGNQQGSGTTCA